MIHIGADKDKISAVQFVFFVLNDVCNVSVDDIEHLINAVSMRAVIGVGRTNVHLVLIQQATCNLISKANRHDFLPRQWGE